VHLSRSLEGSYYLDSEIYVHRRIPLTRMVIEEDIVPASTKLWLPCQEFPDLIQGRTPD
jgi:hypothetical protein